MSRVAVGAAVAIAAVFGLYFVFNVAMLIAGVITFETRYNIINDTQEVVQSRLLIQDSDSPAVTVDIETTIEPGASFLQLEAFNTLECITLTNEKGISVHTSAFQRPVWVDGDKSIFSTDLLVSVLQQQAEPGECPRGSKKQ